MNRLTDERRTMSMCMSVEECQKHNRLWEYEQTGLDPEQIAAMQAELAAYKQAEQWRDPDNDKPENEGYYLGLYTTYGGNDRHIQVVQYYGREYRHQNLAWYSSFHGQNVKPDAWMQLPKIPETRAALEKGE